MVVTATQCGVLDFDLESVCVGGEPSWTSEKAQRNEQIFTCWRKEEKTFRIKRKASRQVSFKAILDSLE